MDSTSQDYQRISEKLDRYMLREDFFRDRSEIVERITRAESSDTALRQEFSQKFDTLSKQIGDLNLTVTTFISSQKPQKDVAGWWKWTATAVISSVISGGGLLALLQLIHALR